MQVAIITATNEQVEIIAVNGGWTTIHTLGADTQERKVRNGALSGHTTLSDTVAAMAMAKAAAKPAVSVEAVQEGRKNGVVFAGYLPQYEAYAAKRADGTTKRSIDKGDGVAVTLRTMDLLSVYAAVSNTTGTSMADLRERFSHLNPGMQRMNLGNMMRRALREAAAATA
jgi:hypothetical protein